jgi:hypothetical protein
MMLDHNDNAASDIPTGPLRPSENSDVSISLDLSVLCKIVDLRTESKRWAAGRETFAFDRLREVKCHTCSHCGFNSGFRAASTERRLRVAVNKKTLLGQKIPNLP